MTVAQYSLFVLKVSLNSK